MAMRSNSSFHALLVSMAMSGVASATLTACPCTQPVVPRSSVRVLDPQGHGINGANITLSGGGTLLTFTGSMDDAGTSQGVYTSVGVNRGTSYTLRVDAPGFQPIDRPLSDDEFTSPTGCGFAATVTVTLNPL